MRPPLLEPCFARDLPAACATASADASRPSGATPLVRPGPAMLPGGSRAATVGYRHRKVACHDRFKRAR